MNEERMTEQRDCLQATLKSLAQYGIQSVSDAKAMHDELMRRRHDERVGKVGFCAISNCKLCPSPYSNPPKKTRTNCSVHKGFKEDCGCP